MLPPTKFFERINCSLWDLNVILKLARKSLWLMPWFQFLKLCQFGNLLSALLACPTMYAWRTYFQNWPAGLVRSEMECASSEIWDNWFYPNWPCSWSWVTQFSWPCAECEKCAIWYLTAALLVCQGPDSRSYLDLFSLFSGWPTKCICFLEVTKLLSSSNVEDVIFKWLPKTWYW